MKKKIIVFIVFLFSLIFVSKVNADMLPPDISTEPEKILYYNIIRNMIPAGENTWYDVYFNEGDRFNVGINLMNKNNVTITYKITDVTVHDHFKLRPNIEPWNVNERVGKSEVDFCSLSFPTSEGIVNGNSEKIINVSIVCQNVSCIKGYEMEDACWLTLIPKITYLVDGKEKEIASYDYYVPSFKLKTENPSEPSNNFGEICKTSDDCIIGSCLYCPSDTQALIQTDEDPSYAELTNNTHFITRKGGDQGFCGSLMGDATRCLGNWNNDEYFIDYMFLRETTGVGNMFVEPAEKLPLVKFLTKDVLDSWKKEVLKNISEAYFNEHFDIDSIHGEVMVEENGNHKFVARIYYLFKYDWATISLPGGNGAWDMFVIAEKINGNWQKLTEDKMIYSCGQELQRWHDLGLVKITEYEIPSIISKEQVISSLEKCDSNMKIDTISIGSENKTIYFTADGGTSRNTERCIIGQDNTYTAVRGSVNLITGESTCVSYDSPCFVYEQKNGGIKAAFGQNLILYAGIGIVLLTIVIVIVFIKRRK